MSDKKKSRTDRRNPILSLRPIAGYLTLWRGVATLLVLTATLAGIEAVRDPEGARESRTREAALFLLALAAVGTATIEGSSLYVDVFADEMTIRRGPSFAGHSVVVSFSSIGRVRVQDHPRLRLTIDLDTGRTLTVANSLTDFNGLQRLAPPGHAPTTPISNLRLIESVINQRLSASRPPPNMERSE